VGSFELGQTGKDLAQKKSSARISMGNGRGKEGNRKIDGSGEAKTHILRQETHAGNWEIWVGVGQVGKDICSLFYHQGPLKCHRIVEPRDLGVFMTLGGNCGKKRHTHKMGGGRPKKKKKPSRGH